MVILVFGLSTIVWIVLFIIICGFIWNLISNDK
nr:MAG TPA: hypothetical protein [Caudoviricetes sp.]